MLEVMMMWITKQVMKWLEKWGTGQIKQPLIPRHPDYSPKLNFFARSKHPVRGHGDWGGCWQCWSVSQWRNTTLPECVPIPPSCAQSVGSPPPVVDFPEISSQNSNQWRGREWEGRHSSPLSWVGSHRKHECERTLELRVTPTSPTLLVYRWRCHRRPWSYDLRFV
jgi:hypothetical protein